MNQTCVEISRSDFEPGTTIVSAVKNRSEPLRYTVSSWLMLDWIERVIIVDWDSNVPLIYSLASFESDLWPNDKVTIVRVENQPVWNLPKAINLGMKLVDTCITFKLDADVLLVDTLPGQELAKEGQFFTSGSWRAARNRNELGMYGSTAFGTYDFWRIGGYDERFSTYGFEDDNFYSRLKAIGIERKFFPHNALYHLPHSDALRIGHQKLEECDLDESIRHNQQLSKKRDRWNPMSSRQQYELLVRANDDRYFVLREQPKGPHL